LQNLTPRASFQRRKGERRVTLEVNPVKFGRFFAPMWLLLTVSALVNWESWQTKPLLFAAIAAMPVIAALLAATVLRGLWRLELTSEALTHHTLGRTERMEWTRMGPLMLKPAPLPEPLIVRTFWFVYPTDEPRDLMERATKLTGKRILCIFGDKSTKETIAEIEAWRALYVR
jgi:hypothetical protein